MAETGKQRLSEAWRAAIEQVILYPIDEKRDTVRAFTVLADLVEAKLWEIEGRAQPLIQAAERFREIDRKYQRVLTECPSCKEADFGTCTEHKTIGILFQEVSEALEEAARRV